MSNLKSTVLESEINSERMFEVNVDQNQQQYFSYFLSLKMSVCACTDMNMTRIMMTALERIIIL